MPQVWKLQGHGAGGGRSSVQPGKGSAYGKANNTRKRTYTAGESNSEDYEGSEKEEEEVSPSSIKATIDRLSSMQSKEQSKSSTTALKKTSVLKSTTTTRSTTGGSTRGGSRGGRTSKRAKH